MHVVGGPELVVAIDIVDPLKIGPEVDIGVRGSELVGASGDRVIAHWVEHEVPVELIGEEELTSVSVAVFVGLFETADNVGFVFGDTIGTTLVFVRTAGGLEGDAGVHITFPGDVEDAI